MTFGELVLALLLGGGLSALGGLAQSWIQARVAIRLARHDKRRAWDAECVDVLADLNVIFVNLRSPSLFGIALSSMDTIDEKWRTELGRALTRIKVGHPDGTVRHAARELEGRMIIGLSEVFKAVTRGRQDTLQDPMGPLRVHLDAIEETLWAFQLAVLGPDADRIRTSIYSASLAQRIEEVNAPSRRETST